MEQRQEQASGSVELHAYFHLPAKAINLVELAGAVGPTRLGLVVVDEDVAA